MSGCTLTWPSRGADRELGKCWDCIAPGVMLLTELDRKPFEGGREMIILFGFRRTRARLGTILVMCGFCHTPAAHAIQRIRKFFTLFFIPVIPLGTKYRDHLHDVWAFGADHEGGRRDLRCGGRARRSVIGRPRSARAGICTRRCDLGERRVGFHVRARQRARNPPASSIAVGAGRSERSTRRPCTTAAPWSGPPSIA